MSVIKKLHLRLQNMSLKKTTKKLFYDKFVYKISVITKLASNFRGGDIDATQYSISHLVQEMEYRGETERLMGHRWNASTVSIQEIRRDLATAHLIAGLKDYFVRVEGDILSLYTNDESVIDTVSELYEDRYSIREVWRPENDKIKEFLLANPKKIIRPEYSHKYKVTVNSIPDVTAFKDWAEKLPKLKVMPKNNYVIGGYFYVADEKTLSLCRLFLGDRIRRVDELRTISEI